MTAYGRRTILYIALLAGGAAAVALTLYNGHREAQLLRADPDTIPGNRELMQFAASRGAAKFRSQCASCHAAAGRGDPVRGVPDLTDGDWLFGSGTVGEIERVVAYGIRSNNPKAWNLARMPGFARAQASPTDAKILPLSPGNIRDVIEYPGFPCKGARRMQPPLREVRRFIPARAAATTATLPMRREIPQSARRIWRTR